VAGLVRQQKRAQVKSASRVQENLARKTWQENLAGKPSRKIFQPFAQVVATAEQSLRRRRTITHARALEVAQK
jgi:hypothetical protein